MTRKVFWSEDALTGAQSILSPNAEDNFQNANLVADRIDHTASLLAETAFEKPGRVVNTYEVFVPRAPFILVYHLGKNNTVSILRLIHSARL
jgi:plasmid stabilization system protein ParE